MAARARQGRGHWKQRARPDAANHEDRPAGPWSAPASGHRLGAGGKIKVGSAFARLRLPTFRPILFRRTVRGALSLMWELTDNLTLVVKGGAARLSPTQCFKLAEKCLRGATRQIVGSEAAEAGNETATPQPSARVNTR